MPNNHPKRQKGEENGTLSGISSAPRAEHDENTITTTTTQRINKTFDEAKEKCKKIYTRGRKRASTVHEDCHNQPRAISGCRKGYHRELS